MFCSQFSQFTPFGSAFTGRISLRILSSEDVQADSHG